jgi:hypothetical protein
MALEFQEATEFVRQAGSFTSSDLSSLIEGDRGWVNRTYIDFVRRTGCFTGSFSNRALTAGQVSYDVPTLFGASDILRFLAITVSGGGFTRKLLNPVDHVQAHLRREDNQAEANVYEYSIVGFNTFLLATAPGSGYTLDGTYVARPVVVSVPTDTFDAVPEEYHDAICAGALALGMRFEDRMDDAVAWAQRYEEFVALCKADLKRFQGLRPTSLRPSRQFGRRSGADDIWTRMGEV